MNEENWQRYFFHRIVRLCVCLVNENFYAFNDSSFKTVTDFKFDTYFQGESGHDLLKIMERGVVRDIHLAEIMHSYELLLVPPVIKWLNCGLIELDQSIWTDQYAYLSRIIQSAGSIVRKIRYSHCACF